MIEGNLLVAHGGGPTAVINGSLYGVVTEAKKHSEIKGIYGARYGIEGVLKEEFVDLDKEKGSTIGRLPYTPSSAIGSCRRKLTEEDFSVLLDVFRRYEIRYFLYNCPPNRWSVLFRFSLSSSIQEASAQLYPSSTAFSMVFR